MPSPPHQVHHGPSTVSKARVGPSRSGSYYYPFRDCLRKCLCLDTACCRGNICSKRIIPGGIEEGATEEEDEGETVVSPILKYALFFVNVLFWIGSLVLIGVGSYALATKEIDGSKRVTSAWDFVFDVTIIFIVIGVLAFVLASCGCIGALRENVCLLKTYWITLIAIDLTLVAIGVIGLSMWSRFVNIAKTKLSDELIINYDDDPDLKDLMDFVQEKFECCGISDQSYLDWNANIYFNCSKTNTDPRACGVPHSCCHPEIRFSSTAKRLENYNCGFQAQNDALPKAVQRIFTLGCVEAMEQSIKHNLLLFCLVAFGVALIPLIAICLAVTLSNQVDDQRALFEVQERRQRRMRAPQYVITRA